jgi:hypothetical protein
VTVRASRTGSSWSPGQKILNDTGARVPEHTFSQPVPITARIVWEQDGEEFIETVAAGWTGQNVYVRLPDRRYRLTSVWLDAADVKRREAASVRDRCNPARGWLSDT